MSPPLAVTGLRAGWAKTPLLNGLDLHVEAGEVLGLLGGNGSGKSTLLAALAGLLRPRAGEVLLNGRDTVGLSPEQIAVAGLRLLPQTRRVFSSLTVEENLTAPELAIGRPDLKVLRQRAADWFAQFPELARRRDEPASSLSGGQQQLLAIGRVVSTSPTVLLLDEPSAGLSAAAEGQVLQAVSSMRQAGVAIVLVEQDLRFAQALADRFVHMRGGRLSEL